MAIEFEKTPEDAEVMIRRLIEDPGPRFPGQTYEDGVRATLDWLLGDEENDPLTDED